MVAARAVPVATLLLLLLLLLLLMMLLLLVMVMVMVVLAHRVAEALGRQDRISPKLSSAEAVL